MICFETIKELEVVLKRAGADKPSELATRIWQVKEEIDRLRAVASEQLTEQEKAFLQEWKASRVKKNRRKFGRKREAVQLKHFGVIHQLRQEGYSYAEISGYLAKYHKIKIDQSSIQRYYTEQLKLIEEAKNEDIN